MERDATLEQAQTDEEERLRIVINDIEHQIKTINRAVEEKRKDVVEMRRMVQEDLANDFSDVEPAIEMVHHSMEMALKEMDYLASMERLSVLDKMQKSPYFGRIDFRYEGETDSESIYVGISSLKMQKSGNHLIYDWRAPISSLFYDYETGPARFQTEAGVVTGDVTLKRQYKIVDGKLAFMFDTGVNIGDDVLQEMMGKHADERMKSIVATIQQEQNQVIRNDETKVLVVQGAAGSGKTSIALQRIAYLLYKYRKSLSSDDILMFTPNDLFSAYIQDVLPELGEARVPQTTFLEFAKKRLGNQVEIEDMPSQMEDLLTASPRDQHAEVRRNGIVWKSSPAFLKLIGHYIKFLENGGLQFRDIRYQGKILISAAEIERVNQNFRHAPLQKRFAPIVSWLRGRVAEFREAMLKRRIAELKAVTSYIGTDAEIEQMAKSEVKKELAPVLRQVKRFALVTATRHYGMLYADPARIKRWMQELGLDVPDGLALICEMTRKRLANKQVPYEDLAPLLYTAHMISPEESYRGVKHVVVDEAQDLSPVHYEVLHRTFPNSRFTILGDLNQSIHPYMNVGQYENLVDVFGHDSTTVLSLQRSYRSTQEIVRFSSAILGDPDLIQSVKRGGDLPMVLRCRHRDKMALRMVDDVTKLLNAGRASVAIICKTAQDSEAWYGWLKPHIEVELVTKDHEDFRGRVCVIPAYLAKGLEFDAVLVVNADAAHYERESDRKLLYTVCSRALHELHVYCGGDVSPFISAYDETLCHLVDVD